MPVSNHAVLLKGVNDSVATMRTLVRGLLRIKVRPYYLFHCDPVDRRGALPHVGLERAGDHRGLAGPRLGPGRADLRRRRHSRGRQDSADAQLPVSASENAVVLRNYEGMMFRYAPEDRGSRVVIILRRGSATCWPEMPTC